MGFDGYLSKPFTTSKLVDVLELVVPDCRRATVSR